MENIERAVALQGKDTEALVEYGRAYNEARAKLEHAHRSILAARAVPEFYAEPGLVRADRFCSALLAAFEDIARPESEGAR